jgi:HEAT repeat protein
MLMIHTVLLLALLQEPAPASAIPTDKDAEAAVKTLKEALGASNADDSKIAAVKEALKTCHERVIKASGELLNDPSDRVKVGVALAIGDTDHPASVDMLHAALTAHLKKPMVLAAVAQALGELGWEASAPRLNELVTKVGDADIRPALADVMKAIGAIGSVSSIDCLVDLLKKLQGPRRNPWPNEGELIKAAQGALRAITGGDAGKGSDFEDWWKTVKAASLAGAKTTWWSKKSHERVTLAVGEKPPADSIAVGVRVTDPPAEAGAKEGKDGGAGAKKKKKKGN